MPNQTSAASRRGLNVLVSLVLFFGVVTLYWPAASYPFIGFDDGEYVSQNAQILPGLSWHGLGWAFTSFDAANWHPLTWLSHMLDCQLFGLNPGRHHLHNVLLHALNTCLLFVVLRRLTGAVWRSAFVAALFAVHPLHVESVAWISERKDVQSTFFFLLTLWAYARYATGNQKSEGRSPKSGNVPVTSELRPLTCEHYWLALLFFALGLMSKPMLVTLPFVLLLLDFWPLKRFELKTQHSQLKTLLPLLAEKLPFFTLTIVSCVLTCLAQKHAIRSLVELPLSDRLANAVVSCGLYVAEFLWPAGLAVFYALRHWPISEILPAIVFLVLVSAWALWRARQSPWLLAGWAWYLGTLVPVLGLVQVGSQSMADRYTYIPGIGLSSCSPSA